MVGRVSTSRAQIAEWLERAASWGVRRFQISPPSCGRCDRERSGRLIEADEYAELATAFVAMELKWRGSYLR